MGIGGVGQFASRLVRGSEGEAFSAESTPSNSPLSKGGELTNYRYWILKMSKLIVFAGLPGVGKTKLARQLAERLGAVLLNKDEVRAALFAADDVDYSSEQNDFCMDVIYRLAGYHLSHHPERPVIVDGRTFSRKYQMDALLEAMRSIPHSLYVVLCRCSMEIAEARIKQDQGSHLARDRDGALLRRVASHFEPITVPHLVVDTGEVKTSESLAKIDDYVG